MANDWGQFLVDASQDQWQSAGQPSWDAIWAALQGGGGTGGGTTAPGKSIASPTPNQPGTYGYPGLLPDYVHRPDVVYGNMFPQTQSRLDARFGWNPVELPMDKWYRPPTYFYDVDPADNPYVPGGNGPGTNPPGGGPSGGTPAGMPPGFTPNYSGLTSLASGPMYPPSYFGAGGNPVNPNLSGIASLVGQPTYAGDYFSANTQPSRTSLPSTALPAISLMDHSGFHPGVLPSTAGAILQTMTPTSQSAFTPAPASVPAPPNIVSPYGYNPSTAGGSYVPPSAAGSGADANSGAASTGLTADAYAACARRYVIGTDAYNRCMAGG